MMMKTKARKRQTLTALLIPKKTKINREALNKLLKEATLKVRPSRGMIIFYNIIGKLPLRIGTFLLLLTSIDTIKIIVQVGIMNRTDSAIQVIYQYRFRPWRLFWAIGDWLWQGSYNCRSVRARGKFTQKAVKFLLRNFIEESISSDNGNRKIIIVSLGSGSAIQLLRGVVDNDLDINMKIVLVDYDPRALDVGRKNVCQLGLEGAVEFQQMMVGRFLRRVVAPMSVNFFEMVGLADYFKDKQLQRYMDEIYTALTPKGLFLGANISSKEEMAYAHNAACWPKMHYRSIAKIRTMIERSGFEEVWIGNCGLYLVWISRKI